MTCKNKVNKTPVHRLSSFYNDYFNSVHPKIQQKLPPETSHNLYQANDESF